MSLEKPSPNTSHLVPLRRLPSVCLGKVFIQVYDAHVKAIRAAWDKVKHAIATYTDQP